MIAPCFPEAFYEVIGLAELKVEWVLNFMIRSIVISLECFRTLFVVCIRSFDDPRYRASPAVLAWTVLLKPGLAESAQVKAMHLLGGLRSAGDVYQREFNRGSGPK
jgi:hypothetical protein